jgi:hypothetical protein
MRSELVLIVVLAACGGGGSKPAPQAPSSPPPEEKTVDPVLLRDLADGLLEVLATMATITEAKAEDGKVDCPAMAIQLTRLFEQSTELFELARVQGADPDAGPLLTAEMDQRAAAVQPLVDRIKLGLARCQMDPDVAAAMERMPTF